MFAGALVTLALIGASCHLAASWRGPGPRDALEWAPALGFVIVAIAAVSLRSAAPWPVRLALATVAYHLFLVAGCVLIWRGQRDSAFALEYLRLARAFDDWLARAVIWLALALGSAASIAYSPRSRRRAVRRLAWVLAVLLAGFLFCGIAARLAAAMAVDSPRSDEELVYANLVPFVVAFGALALAALAALAIAHWRTLSVSGAGSARRGRVVAAAAPSRVRLRGWLAGFESEQDAFVLAAGSETIAVPDGAVLVSRLPGASVRLHPGDALAIVEPGEEVVVVGPAQATGNPYRSVARFSGSDVNVLAARGSRAATLALQLYRPCVIYLAVFAAVALAALTVGASE